MTGVDRPAGWRIVDRALDAAEPTFTHPAKTHLGFKRKEACSSRQSRTPGRIGLTYTRLGAGELW